MSEEIVLHQWEISPFCQKVARVLRFKGLAFRPVNYNGLLAARVGTLSKAGKVPVLDMDGQRLQDSTRIARYLETRFPDRPLLPADPVQRALVGLWEDWADESLYWFEVHFRINDPEALAQAVDYATRGRRAIERIPARLAVLAGLRLQLYCQGLGRLSAAQIEEEFLGHLDRIEAVLASSSWLVGETITLADIAVASQLLEVQRTSAVCRPALVARPYLSAWLARVDAI